MPGTVIRQPAEGGRRPSGDSTRSPPPLTLSIHRILTSGAPRLYGYNSSWYSPDGYGTTYEITNLNGSVVYYVGTLCPTDKAGASCDIQLPVGTYMWRVYGALDRYSSEVRWEFCGTGGGAQSTLVFSVDSTGRCVPDQLQLSSDSSASTSHVKFLSTFEMTPGTGTGTGSSLSLPPEEEFGSTYGPRIAEALRTSLVLCLSHREEGETESTSPDEEAAGTDVTVTLFHAGYSTPARPSSSTPDPEVTEMVFEWTLLSTTLPGEDEASQCEYLQTTLQNILDTDLLQHVLQQLPVSASSPAVPLLDVLLKSVEVYDDEDSEGEEEDRG